MHFLGSLIRIDMTNCNDADFVRCEVLIPHCRKVKGVLYMVEPAFSKFMYLPNDDETRIAIDRGYIRLAAN